MLIYAVWIEYRTFGAKGIYTMSVLELKVYEIFKPKLGEDEAATLIEYFDAKAEEKLNQKKDVFLTKEDKVDIIKWMVGMWVAQMAAIVFLILKR